MQNLIYLFNTKQNVFKYVINIINKNKIITNKYTNKNKLKMI